MQPKGFHHVQLAMPEGGEETARGFYAGLLGMTEVQKPPALAGRGGCWFEAGTMRLHLGVERPFAAAKKAHPAIEVAGIDAWAERLEAGGAPVLRDVPLPGLKRFHTADPFGNRIEIVETVPAV